MDHRQLLKHSALRERHRAGTLANPAGNFLEGQNLLQEVVFALCEGADRFDTLPVREGR